MEKWRERLVRRAVFGEWLFSSEETHQTRSRPAGPVIASTTCAWLLRFPAGACTGSGTAWPLTWSGGGELLRTQQRLGHRDPSTTLRNYAHALPLEDEDVADDIDELLAVRQEVSVERVIS